MATYIPSAGHYFIVTRTANTIATQKIIPKEGKSVSLQQFQINEPETITVYFCEYSTKTLVKAIPVALLDGSGVELKDIKPKYFLNNKTIFVLAEPEILKDISSQITAHENRQAQLDSEFAKKLIITKSLKDEELDPSNIQHILNDLNTPIDSNKEQNPENLNFVLNWLTNRKPQS
jgi:hypothetical protein